MPNGNDLMYGAGWTGQPLLISEKGKKYIFQGALDHNLKKIDADSGELIWEYKFDDVIKGTGTLWYNKKAANHDNRLIVLQGSRQGYDFSMGSKYIWSFRGVSGITGDELYRINVKRTESVSRDVDGSALVINDTAYIGFENGLFDIFNPDEQKCIIEDGYNIPEIFSEEKLYDKTDVAKHRGIVINESSPCRIGNTLYYGAGSGYIYGYDLTTKIWSKVFYVGTDLDGTLVATDDNCLLVSVEKVFIQGNGGMLKLDPSKPESEALVWFFPTGNKTLSDWNGGVIGTPCINDFYVGKEDTHIAVFLAIDGYMYVVDHKNFDDEETLSFDGKHRRKKPKLLYKYNTGGSISSPIILQNKIIAAGYGGLFLFSYDSSLNFKLLEKHPGVFEASPIVYDKKIYIGGKDGWLYCLGE
jgi:outer membrane protein assembly factor BamB